MKKRTSRPLLRAATLTAGSLLIGCGSGQKGGGIPLPGNPKGAHYNDSVLVSGTVNTTYTAADPKAMVVVTIQADVGGPPLAQKTLPAGPFPMTFELTAEDRVAGTDPIPEKMILTVRLDEDGDVKTRAPTEPIFMTDLTRTDTQNLTVMLVEPPPPLPLPGNPKGSHYNDPPPPPPPSEPTPPPEAPATPNEDD